MFSDNEVDDKVKNRKNNISLYSNIFGKEFKHNKNKKEYARNTCIRNKEYDVDISPGGFVGMGSFGVARTGKYISLKDGKIKDGIIKVIVARKHKNKLHGELQEIKIGIEASMMCPEAVVDVELLNRCDVLAGLNYSADKVNQSEDLIIIGMEKGIDLNKYIQVNYKNTNKIVKVAMSAIEACDRFNLHGFFHNDIKQTNIIVVKRNNIDTAVLIDFGKTEYMNSIRYLGANKKYVVRDFSLINPPFDSFYLSLMLFGQSNIFFDILLKYYFILLACGITQDELEKIYTSFAHYNLQKKLFKFYKKLFDENISSLVIPAACIKYVKDRKVAIVKLNQIMKNTLIPEPITVDKLRRELIGVHKNKNKNNKPVCSSNRKTKNSNELTLKEAKLLCKNNNLIQSGNKKEICDRLSGMKLVA